MAVAPVRAEQQLRDPITVKIAQQPAGRLVVVVHGQKIVAEVGLRLACTGAPQVADLGEQRVVGSVAGRARRIATRRGRKHGGGRAHFIYVDSVVLQKSREYAL